MGMNFIKKAPGRENGRELGEAGGASACGLGLTPNAGERNSRMSGAEWWNSRWSGGSLHWHVLQGKFSKPLGSPGLRIAIREVPRPTGRGPPS